MSYDNPRINDLNMSAKDILMIMCDGNPGGLTTMMQLMDQTLVIDPDNSLGSLGPLLTLDTLDCYGSHIWILYKDICEQNCENMLGVLRAIQLGFISDTEVMDCIRTHETYTENRKELDVADLLRQVKERLPNFGVKDT